MDFWRELQNTGSISDVLQNSRLREGLISTAGVSAKARHYLTDDDIQRILTGIIAGIPADRVNEFRQELFYRYLLTKGASLDGEMRNYAGAQAARMFIVSLLDALQIGQDPLVWLKDVDGSKKLPEARSLAESHKVQKIAWSKRILLFDKKPALIDKNVDMILLNTTKLSDDTALLQRHDCYLACGELKGGIDPAGADEHWKTARSAIDRVAAVFSSKRKKPALFFVGAAIEDAMSKELFTWLQSGKLKHAANLTVPQQVQDLIAWLIKL
jgi:type II restriction enzyme